MTGGRSFTSIDLASQQQRRPFGRLRGCGARVTNIILSLLSRSKQPEPSISAHVIGGPFLPGDQVDVELIWHDGKGGGPIEVSLDLVCRETFWYTVKSTGAAFIGSYPGHDEENYTGPPYTAAGRPGRYKTFKDLVRLSNRVALVNQDLGQNRLRGFASFQLPAAAPSTIQGNTACVEWELRARLASNVSSDYAVGKIILLSKPERSVGNQAKHHDSTDTHRPSLERCIVSLSLPEGHLITGQVLHGVLKAKAQGDVNITKVQAELECCEQAGAKQSTAVYATAELQGRSMLHAGQEYQWPFQLQVPDRLLPSAILDETSVVWQVKGILGRKFRTRLETATQVQVFSTGQEGQS